MKTSQSHSVNVSQTKPSDNEADVLLKNVRSIILGVLAQCEIQFVVKPYDQHLHDRCLAFCEERGYPIGPNSYQGSNDTHVVENEPSLLPFLPTGVYIASTSYGHLKSDMPRVIYIALYTAFIAYLDDFFKRDIETAALFGMRLTRGEKQGHPLLDSLADLLMQTDAHFGPAAANIIVQDTLGYLTSLFLENETQGLKWSQHARALPHYIRQMSAIPNAYTMFLFPRDIPLTRYIQSIPEIGDYIGDINDVLSFYKEEIRGEEDNYISLVSNAHNLTKNEVLKKLADKSAGTIDRIDKILAGDSAALHTWTMFKAGYVHFHISFNTRYKLDQLNLGWEEHNN